ncbi:MAG: hypothetical protein QM538_02310 [Methylacidiphilales bacterium]|nr:hypothetical protein [Candidatus Methylacidiphilales bacterium]
MTYILLIASLLLLVLAAEILTNGFEHFGMRLKISEGVTGSIFAAVATALPEATVPLVAIFGSAGGSQTSNDIGIGAILGAPLMLSTLSIFLMSAFVVKQRTLTGYVTPEYTGIKRDLIFFIIFYLFATLAFFIPHERMEIKIIIASIMVLGYVLYLKQTIQASNKLVDQGHGTSADHPLLFTRVTKLPTNLLTIIIQLILAFILMIFSAEIFIDGIKTVSLQFDISPLLLSLAIVPVATELPEKVNSILWIRKGKDTLAFGNITGALVFQGSLLPAIGILCTPWNPNPLTILSSIITIFASVWLLFIHSNKGFKISNLLVCGIFYITYFVIIAFQ